MMTILGLSCQSKLKPRYYNFNDGYNKFDLNLRENRSFD